MDLTIFAGNPPHFSPEIGIFTHFRPPLPPFSVRLSCGCAMNAARCRIIVAHCCGFLVIKMPKISQKTAGSLNRPSRKLAADSSADFRAEVRLLTGFQHLVNTIVMPEPLYLALTRVSSPTYCITCEIYLALSPCFSMSYNNMQKDYFLCLISAIRIANQDILFERRECLRF